MAFASQLFDWLPATRGYVKEMELHMQAEIVALKEKLAANNAVIKANLANVAGDIANLNEQIKVLNDKVAAGTPLTQEDKDAFAAMAADSNELVNGTKTLSDIVADAV